MILSQFQAVGRDLFMRGLVSSHSGNLSIRMGDRIIITRRGSKLGSLVENDLIETGINKNDRFTPLASSELAVHRSIYRETPAQAIVHAHPPHAVALSMVDTEIVPNNMEGATVIGHVPCVGWNMEITPGALAGVIAAALLNRQVIMVHSHGSFAVGQLLEDAYKCTTALEESAQVLCLLKSLQVNSPKELP